MWSNVADCCKLWSKRGQESIASTDAPSVKIQEKSAHLQSSVFKLSKDLIDSIHEEGIVAYTS